MSWRDRVHPITKRALESAMEEGVEVDEETLSRIMDEKAQREDKEK